MKRRLLPLLIIASLTLAGCNTRQSEVIDLNADSKATQTLQPQTNEAQTKQGATMADYRGDVKELKIEDTVVGTGPEVKAGDTIEVHYTGKLLDGKVFDSSIPRGQTASFGIGIGQVIEGWDKGLIGMKVGGTRVLTIPPEMGYGARGAGASIPPDASLIFEVQLVSIK
jgi:FKBP-type peptidyl-prolyl cis-trans isomerase FkpA